MAIGSILAHHDAINSNSLFKHDLVTRDVKNPNLISIKHGSMTISAVTVHMHINYICVSVNKCNLQ